MNCVLFAGMNQVFSLEKKTTNITLKNTGKGKKNTGKVPDLIAKKYAS